MVRLSERLEAVGERRHVYSVAAVERILFSLPFFFLLFFQCGFDMWRSHVRRIAYVTWLPPYRPLLQSACVGKICNARHFPWVKM